jgi:hypothetical protein
MDISTSVASAARQGSSDIGVQREYDLLSRNVGPNTGRAGNGFTLTWDDRSLSAIGIPGRITRFQLARATIAEGDDGLSSFTDKSDYGVYLGVQPFSQVKNKWISGLQVDAGAWFCNIDDRAADNGCDRFRIQDSGDAARQTLFDTGGDSNGQGWFRWYQPGVTWTVGPYRLRGVYGWARAEDSGGTPGGQKKANGWLIGHDLFIWSPKGFLTGSPTAPGSILLGYHFERNDVSVDCQPNCAGGHLAQFHRNTIRVNEWGIAYFFAPRMSLLGTVYWYDAKNLRVGANQACHNLGVCSDGTARDGKGGDWVDGSITLRFSF